ncbi:FAD-dependent oxidoreductase [Candidatus Daviesbacteria bacterium]|nr:FAD-dependent oxidoreductase [Candidatus Daviesbacteria bacterium]
MNIGKKKKVVIIGAGPAGLAAAYEFLRQDQLSKFKIEIYEMDSQVGGLAKTLYYKGYRFDLGGHRFYTKFPEINNFYKNFLKRDMLVRKRLSRIYYDKKFYNYPLLASNALKNLGIKKSIKIILSWIKRQFNKYKDEFTFDQWVANRFGDELFKIFFKSYTEKVWGIKTSKLSADWAAQRIQNFTLSKAILNALFQFNTGSKTIIKKFYYPKYGPGMLYERIKSLLEKNNVKIFLNHEITGFNLSANNVGSINIQDNLKKKIKKVKTDVIVSTMPFDKLVSYLNPPKNVKVQISKLKFRNFIAVNLIVKSNPFPDQWIYIHDPNVKVGRIQNFKNWSPFMIKEGKKNTAIGMEYFSSEGDDLWQMADEEIINLAKQEIEEIGLIQKNDIEDAFVCRARNAYPIYDFNYQIPLKAAKNFISKFSQIYPCGRGGLFRYNNQDHSILAGFYTARNIIAGKIVNDVWGLNESDNYLEEKTKKS